MANKIAKYSTDEFSIFGKAIDEYRIMRGIPTQAELARRANMPKGRMSRIMYGKDKKGNTVSVNEHDINQLAFALRLGKKGRDELRYKAWPELEYADRAFDCGESLGVLNSRLVEVGLPTYGDYDYVEDWEDDDDEFDDDFD